MTRPKPKKAVKKPKPAGLPDPDKQPDASTPLSNARHERFCQNLAMHGMSQTHAYVLAGYPGTEESARRAGSLLMTKNDVVSRLGFLKFQAAALAIDVASLSKADVLNMIGEQHQRNIGVRPVMITKAIKTGKHKGKLETVQRYAYNEHAASQTLKLLGDEFAIGLGMSGNRGDAAGDIAARAGVADPKVAEDLGRLEHARRLAIAGDTDIEGKVRKSG